MTDKSKKTKKELQFEAQLAELTADLQRTRADFENYRKRVEIEKSAARDHGKSGVIMQLVPIVDTIERAVAHMPVELADNKWAQGIAGLAKSLEKSLDNLGIKRIEAKPGTEFNPELHEAVQFDEEAVGEKEVITEELQAGYTLNSHPIRHAIVKVTRE